MKDALGVDATLYLADGVGACESVSMLFWGLWSWDKERLLVGPVR